MSLCYNPTANTITVSIIKARNLKAMDIGGTSGKKKIKKSKYIYTTFISHLFHLCNVFQASQNDPVLKKKVFLLHRPLCKSVVDEQGQARGKEEDGGNEALSQPCVQRVLPI